MNQEEYQNNIIAIANHYDYESQSRQLIEEMAELTVAINKLWRIERFCDRKNIMDVKGFSYPETKEIIEEIADVEIMLSQIKYLLGCQDEVELEKERKILRQLERIKGEVEGE